LKARARHGLPGKRLYPFLNSQVISILKLSLGSARGFGLAAAAKPGKTIMNERRRNNLKKFL
jgi:hypothetical protein